MSNRRHLDPNGEWYPFGSLPEDHVSEYEGDPQEYVTLTGDDGEVARIPVPRVWHLPSKPAAGISVRDRDGKVWARRPDDPSWVDLWYAGGMNAMHWHDLLGRRGPLTEVL